MKSNRREQNQAAKAARIASWTHNQEVKPEPKTEVAQITPKTSPKVTALGYIGKPNQEPTVVVSETTGALTPNYSEVTNV